MALLPFLQKQKDMEEGKSEPIDKKIEFAQKLPSEDLEGKAAPKAGDFNFLQGFNRQPGEKAPVKIMDKPPIKPLFAKAPEDKPEKFSSQENPFNKEKPESPAEKKSSTPGWLSNIFKGSGEVREKNTSSALEVNLVKGEIVKYFDWQRGLLIILVAVFSTMAVLSGLYWGISVWGSSSQSSQNSDYLQQYYKLSKQLSDLNPQVVAIKDFKAKLDRANFLLARHIYWTNLFSFLENNTLSDVYLNSFSGGLDGNYSFGATTDNLDAIDAQVKKLQANPYVISVSVNSGAIVGSGGMPVVNFALPMVLNPKIFLK
jgi:hypothetical protein